MHAGEWVCLLPKLQYMYTNVHVHMSIECDVHVYVYHSVTVQVFRVQADIKALEERLTETWNETESSYLTEAMVLQMLQAQIQQHLDTAKQEWLKLVSGEMCKLIYMSLYMSSARLSHLCCIYNTVMLYMLRCTYT